MTGSAWPAVIADDDVEQMLRLISTGFDINGPVDDGDPLLTRVTGGKLRMLRALLAAGANVNVTTRWGRTALHSAVGQYRLDAVELLLKAGADPNIANHSGQTPLMIAAAHHAAKFVRPLLGAGADPLVVDSMFVNALFYAERGKVEPNPAAKLLRRHGAVHTPWAAARLAMDAHDLQRFIAAVEAGADLTANDPCEFSLLHYACMDRENALIVQNLLVRGAEPNGNWQREEMSARRPLHLAADAGALESVQLLLEAGAHREVRDSQGGTPLDAALNSYSQTRSTAVTHWLLNAGCTACPEQLLALAIQEHRPDEIARILAAGIDVAARFFWMGGISNALDWAVRTRQYDVVRTLLDLGMPPIGSAKGLAISLRDPHLQELLGMPTR